MSGAVVSVLVVEDSSKDREAIVATLSTFPNFRIAAQFGTEAEARQWILEHKAPWDMAIIDLILKEGSGMSLIDPCREANPHGTVVVLSHFTTSGVTAHCRRLGADHVFHKEQQFDRFVELCEHLGTPAVAQNDSSLRAKA